MTKNERDRYGEQDLRDMAAFWLMLIPGPEIKNPDDLLPEMQCALAGTQAFLANLYSAGC